MELEMAEAMPVDLCQAFAGLLQPEVANYSLARTFLLAFVVLEVGRRGRGVLLV